MLTSAAPLVNPVESVIARVILMVPYIFNQVSARNAKFDTFKFG